MGPHFHHWIDYNGGCIFNRVTRMGSHILAGRGENILASRDFGYFINIGRFQFAPDDLQYKYESKARVLHSG